MKKPGQPQCGAKSKWSGTRCKKKAVKGYRVCATHGAGCPIRVKRGERKPPGRPLITGEYADPKRTRYGRLAELVEEVKADPAGLRTAELELTLIKAALRWQYEKLLAGEWDIMKTPELMEHPASWIVNAGAKIVEKVAKANAMIDRDRVQGLLVLVDPVINVVLAIIDQFVSDERKLEARDFVRAKLGQVLLPTG